MPPNIRAEWAYDLETVMEKAGWEALWKISRPTCESFNIPYPVIVLVEVLGMDFSKLNAIVKVKAVLDNNIHLPEKHEVPLIELYPTISQKNRTLDIEGTAHCVDRVRFFYHYLWMPWDEEEDDDTIWVKQHLESRLKLYYDMKNKVINDETCEIIRSLIKEAKEVKKKISIYEALLPEDMHEDEIPKELAKEAYGLMKFHFRLQQIKAEMDLLENPSLRKLLGHNQSFNRREKRKDGKNIYYFVWLGGVVKQLQELSIKIQTMLPENAPIKYVSIFFKPLSREMNKIITCIYFRILIITCIYFRISGCLDDALDTIEPGDTVLLSEGHHSVKRYNELQKGGTIIGICNVENTVLCSIESDVLLALLDFSGIEVLYVTIVQFGFFYLNFYNFFFLLNLL